MKKLIFALAAAVTMVAGAAQAERYVMVTHGEAKILSGLWFKKVVKTTHVMRVQTTNISLPHQVIWVIWQNPLLLRQQHSQTAL